ncbi:MAG: TetR/AcrR family transcriptional regulator [Roseiarcus sp.]|uniref:TetR/AcrR family transcriptional regulator n=1 Tax=Roseiarcus sp. TaxID=1969460 RepID=UPI003C5D6FC4
MANINLERRAEIGREKRARTKAQLIAAANALYSTRPWESVTVDEVVSEAGVAKGTFYTHFNDLNELAAAVADELVKSVDELIQPYRLSLPDPLLRIAFGCDAFFQKSLDDRLWASLAARMARSYPTVGKVARKRFSEDLSEALKQSSQAGLSLQLALEVSIGIVVQVMAAIGEGRLKDGDRTEAVRCILTAVGVRGRDAASICARLSDIRRANSARHP